jgi:Coenzyme PQQ synthesis protein D (PqqD)
VFPRARKDRLTIRELFEETLVYDQVRHKGHCLNATAALVWRHCDGRTSIDDLARILAGELGIPQAAEVVGLALEQLGRRHLLEEAPRPLPAADRLSRRDALKRLALAAAALPLVMSVATKAAAQSISDPGPPPPPSPSSSAAAPVAIAIQIPVVIQESTPSRQSSPPAPPPCRQRGQSCLAPASGQQGTCCAGLTCTGVAQGAGVCG